MIEGTKILSFTHYLQGPSCAQILADLGADVVKVESLKGAFERSWSGCDTYLNGVSVFFLLDNRNQRSLSIDLKSEEARDIIYKMIEEYDIIIENFRPGVMDRLGFSYQMLSQINPRIIYCSCSGYGSSGPYLNRAGQDLLAQSYSGLVSINGPGGFPPFPMGTALVDQHGATLAALGVLAAIYDREKTGKGHKIDASLLNAAIDLQLEPLVYYMNGGKLTERAETGLSTRIHQSPYGVYRTSDGFITVSLTPYNKLEKALEPGAISGFKPEEQMSRRIEFDKVFADQMVKKTTDEWMKIFDEFDIWYAPVNEYADVLEDPQVKWNEVVLQMEHPVAGTVSVLNHANRYDGAAPPLRRLPPELGEHSEELLTDCGFSNEEIASLMQKGVIGNGK